MRDEIRRRLVERVWSPGERIPDEAALALELGCARATVNRALRSLADDGLLDRRRKGGTRVAQSLASRARISIPILRVEVEASGRRHAHRVLRRRTAPAPEAVRVRLGVAAGRPLLRIATLHLADDRPFAFEDRWIDPRAAPGIEALDLESETVNEWLVGHVPLSHGTIAFSAAGADRARAGALDVAPGTALFVVERTTWHGARAVTWVRLSYAPGYALETSL